MTPPAVSMAVSPNTTAPKRTYGPLGNGCGATDVLWRITPTRTASFVLPARQRPPSNCRGKRHARNSDERLASWGLNGSRRTVPSKRTDRAAVRNSAGPVGEGNAFGRDRQHRSRESLFGNALSSGVGKALHGDTAQAAQRAPTAGSTTRSSGDNPERACGPQGGGRSHGQLGRNPLGRATRRSLCRSSRCASGNRTASGRFALAALPRKVPSLAPLPER